MEIELSSRLTRYLSKARVARLGTLNKDGTVHLVPVVFANTRNRIYFVIDKKAKRSKLRRIENIKRSKKATLLIDNYSEDWPKLSFLLLYCGATILREGFTAEKELAASLLNEKYTQYSEGGFFPDDIENAVLVRLTPLRAVFWQNLRHSLG